ncbi:hypothetical protein EAO73_25945 [Streptomyces sp. col6]|uniref:hypothetical protein n=1 Tax=Streptomyces sp. col6 TaxID=2478958 RepID=UPI0011CDBB64|nr:hypothetical protein [Streptomyces sp. col6]TXS00677.1 hypothetical protein EAO73_25945 [Streptomyces sp. col6]
MSGGAAGRPGSTRLAAVCVLLLGLFLMHGAPATAAEGCHGAMPSMAASAQQGHTASAMAPAQMQDTVHGAPVFRAGDGAGMRGALCVSTPAPERNPLPAPALLAFAAALSAGWASAAWRAAVNGTRRRGPPAGGRDLVTRVCIART